MKTIADYIKREDVLTIIKTSIFDLEYSGDNDELQEEIKTIPAADVVERKTGKWVMISTAGIYDCSQCGQNVMTSDIAAYKFCHGCGAQMIGGDDDV